MSLEIYAKLICDTCGAEICSDVEHRATWAGCIPKALKDYAQREGWVEVKRGRYHTPTHYCPACADKPARPVPRKKVVR